MKSLTVLFFLVAHFSMGQTYRLGSFVPIDIPNKHLMPKAGIAGGLGIVGSYAPPMRLPFALELKANVGSYSSKTLQQTYSFSDGGQTVTDVSYSSNFHKLILGLRFSSGYKWDGMEFYLTPQIGVAGMRSRIYIADPADEDNCKPLESTVLQRDAGWLFGAELGVETQINKIIPSAPFSDNHRLFFSISSLNSTRKFDYINIKHMQDEVHEMTAEGHEHTNEEGRDLTTAFVNVGSNNLHEHKIAEIYTTPLRYIGLQIGYIYRF